MQTGKTQVTLPVAISDHLESMGAVEAADCNSYAHPHNRNNGRESGFLGFCNCQI